MKPLLRLLFRLLALLGSLLCAQALAAPVVTSSVDVPAHGSDTLSLQLLVAPTSPLALDLRPRTGSVALQLSTTSLTFTPSNWNQPQSLTMKFSDPVPSSNRYAACEIVGPASLPIREIYLRTFP